MSKQRMTLFLNDLPFSPTPLFLEEIFNPHPYCQIRESQLEEGSSEIRIRNVGFLENFA